MSRESVLARTMVELADNLVTDFDVRDLLTTLVDRCVEVLDVAAAGLALRVVPAGVNCTISVVGELDLATRNRLFLMCTRGNHRFTTVDMSGLTFMDCSGYAGIIAARHVVEADDRTLTVRGLIGQPQHPLDLIARHERQPQPD